MILMEWMELTELMMATWTMFEKQTGFVARFQQLRSLL